MMKPLPGAIRWTPFDRIAVREIEPLPEPENLKAMTLPTDPQARKNIPLARGLLDYFPDALLAVAELSRIGNEQHNPGQPLHWAKEKSTDEPDALMRHLIQRGTVDTDGVRHSAKVAWRALALLQREIDAEQTTGATTPLVVMVGGGGGGGGIGPLDPLAQRPDENAKQHRDRVNSPWAPAEALREGYRPGPYARQPDDFASPDDLPRISKR